jgi:hypothetical protein
MAEMKTKANRKSVELFLDGIKDEKRSEDCTVVSRLMEKITGAKPKMWGDSIVGFGSYHYKYASGREGDWFLTGYSLRKSDLTIYLMCDLEKNAGLLKKLGKHKTGKSCLYLKSLDDIDIDVLIELIRDSVKKLSKDRN